MKKEFMIKQSSVDLVKNDIEKRMCKLDIVFELISRQKLDSLHVRLLIEKLIDSSDPELKHAFLVEIPDEYKNDFDSSTSTLSKIDQTNKIQEVFNLAISQSGINVEEERFIPSEIEKDIEADLAEVWNNFVNHDLLKSQWGWCAGIDRCADVAAQHDVDIDVVVKFIENKKNDWLTFTELKCLEEGYHSVFSLIHATDEMNLRNRKISH